jgi:hypothetical protein
VSASSQISPKHSVGICPVDSQVYLFLFIHLLININFDHTGSGILCVHASETQASIPLAHADGLSCSNASAHTTKSKTGLEAMARTVECMGAHGDIPKPEGMHRDEGQSQRLHRNGTKTWKAQHGQYRKPQKATHHAWLDAPIPDPRIYGPNYVACAREETTDLYSPGSPPTHLPSSNGDNNWVDVGREAPIDFRYSHTELHHRPWLCRLFCHLQ